MYQVVISSNRPQLAVIRGKESRVLNERELEDVAIILNQLSGSNNLLDKIDELYDKIIRDGKS